MSNVMKSMRNPWQLLNSQQGFALVQTILCKVSTHQLLFTNLLFFGGLQVAVLHPILLKEQLCFYILQAEQPLVIIFRVPSVDLPPLFLHILWKTTYHYFILVASLNMLDLKTLTMKGVFRGQRIFCYNYSNNLFLGLFVTTV